MCAIVCVSNLEHILIVIMTDKYEIEKARGRRGCMHAVVAAPTTLLFGATGHSSTSVEDSFGTVSSFVQRFLLGTKLH